MNIFGIGLPEMAVIAAIALLVFGPKRLPEMGRSLGRTLKGFQTASSEFEQEFRSALSTAEAAAAPAGTPLEPAATPLPVAAAPEVSEATPAAPASAAVPASAEAQSPAQG
jgi:sec-independent protein translocase protein TatA